MKGRTGRSVQRHVDAAGKPYFLDYRERAPLAATKDMYRDKDGNVIKDIPPLVDVAGLRVSMMTCYDVRFPGLARRLALDGADLLVLPAAWIKGPNKEMYWDVLLKARALDNTIYVAACGECGERTIGNSMVVDPLGVAVARAAEALALVFAEIDPARTRYAREVLPVLRNRRFETPVLKRQ